MGTKIQLFTVLIILILISCKKEKRVDKKELGYYKINIIPDTVTVGKEYKVKIKYISPLDTVKLSRKVTRNIFLFLTTQKGVFNNVKEIQNVKHDVFIKEIDDVFLDFKFSFNRKGLNNFKGIIEDMIIMDDYYDNGKSRVITHIIKIEEEVFVKEE